MVLCLPPRTHSSAVSVEVALVGENSLPSFSGSQFSPLSLSRRISYFSSGTECSPPHPWHRPALAMMPPPAAQDLRLGPRGMRAGSCARVSWKGASPGPCPAPPCLRISDGAWRKEFQSGFEYPVFRLPGIHSPHGGLHLALKESMMFELFPSPWH